MSKFLDDITEDINSDADALIENISEEDANMGECLSTVYDNYMSSPYTGDEWYVGRLCGNKNLANHSLGLLIQDMEELIQPTDNGYDEFISGENAGVQKSIDLLKKIQKELKEAIDY